jgi:serine/threonine protein phosphatase 1
LFVHAGIRPGVPMYQQIEDDLIWIGEPFLTVESDHPWLIVHGHTALDCPHHFGNRIDLDGGAGYGRPLLPAVFEGSTCWMITEDGRKELKPGVAFQ